MSGAGEVQTVILCGGRGTRLREYTEAIPKMLVEIGGRPILWHIMQSYAHAGFDDFVLALGHLGERIKEYFLEESWRDRDFRLRMGGVPEMLDGQAEDWCITFAETGAATNTGGRIARVRPYLRNGVFFATYGDGLSDLSLKALLDFHRSHGRIATVTAVRPRSNFGVLALDEGSHVQGFNEKPRLDAWMNGGFFVFDHRIFDYLDDDSVLEREPMQRLAADEQLMAYRHEGFWACMDTYKDHEELNSVWESGDAPWCWWDRR